MAGGGSADGAPGACLPELPAGHHAQSSWSFHDPAGRFAYEFQRVYGPPSGADVRGPMRTLDEDLSYWGVTWRTLAGTAQERPAGRWMTYARARATRPRLTFARFSSLQMREELPALLLGDAPPAQNPDTPAGRQA